MAAETYKDVEGQSARQRLEDFFKYQEDKQVNQSNAGFDKGMSETERGLVQRGMQRSSYGRQVVGNLARQKVLAANDIRQALLSDYGNRLYQIERDETADRQWQMQFDESRRQLDEQMAWNREQAATQAAQWQNQFDAANSQWQWEADFKQAQADAAAAASASRSGGGSRGSGSGGTSPATSSPSDAALLAMYAVNGTANTTHKGASTAYNSVKNLFKK
jgi:hypothetical protein